MENNKIDKLIKEERNSYMKEWRKNNKKRIQKINKRYWLKKSQLKKEGIKNDNK